mmetsp:Transcript_3407/g.9854  ORF Transcript_3407/g.9854 Transcript_3407/m.9854 type:complete len:246 (-) Transcript_3407:233-970(-)
MRVHSALECCGGLNLLWLLPAIHELDEGQCVHADVQQSAAALARLPQSFDGLGGIHPKVCLDVSHLSDAARVCQSPGSLVGGEEAVPVALCQKHTILLGSRDHVSGLGGIQRNGLLAQDMLPSIHEHDGRLPVLGMQVGNVHDVNLFVIRQLCIAAVAAREAVPLRKIGRSVCVAAGGRSCESSARQKGKRRTEIICNFPAACHSPADGDIHAQKVLVPCLYEQVIVVEHQLHIFLLQAGEAAQL